MNTGTYVNSLLLRDEVAVQRSELLHEFVVALLNVLSCGCGIACPREDRYH